MVKEKFISKLCIICLIFCFFYTSCLNNTPSKGFVTDLVEKDLYNSIFISVPVVDEFGSYYLIITNTDIYQNIYRSNVFSRSKGISKTKSFRKFLLDLFSGRNKLTKDQVLGFSDYYLIKSEDLAYFKNMKSEDILAEYFTENTKDYVLDRDFDDKELLAIIHTLFYANYKIVFDDYEGYYYAIK